MSEFDQQVVVSTGAGGNLGLAVTRASAHAFPCDPVDHSSLEAAVAVFLASGTAIPVY